MVNCCFTNTSSSYTSERFVLDGELVYRDPSGGLSILVMDTSTVKVLMTNTTFVSLKIKLIDFCNEFKTINFYEHSIETTKCRKAHCVSRSEICPVTG